MRKQEHSLFFGVDKMTVCIYALLVLMGWLNIYAAVYNEDHQNIFDDIVHSFFYFLFQL